MIERTKKEMRNDGVEKGVTARLRLIKWTREREREREREERGEKLNESERVSESEIL